jgi:hypothetical protein
MIDRNCQWRVVFLWSAQHEILYHVHHIFEVYIALCFDMLAVGAHDRDLRSELTRTRLRPLDIGWVGGAFQGLAGVMYPAGMMKLAGLATTRIS